MQTKMSILFYAKRAKTTTVGLVPIYLRITIDGQRLEISTKRYVESSKWSSESGKMKGNSEEARSLNSFLDITKGSVYDYQKELMQQNLEVNIENMRGKVLGIKEKVYNIVSVFQEHNDRMKALIGVEYAAGTLERYITTITHVIEFLKWKFNVKDMDIKKIDHSFISDFDFFLRSVHKCNNNTTVKYLKNFGKIIRICIANGWITQSPFINFKTKLIEVERAFLDEGEIAAIVNKNFTIDRLRLVRDIFIFSCYTGLAYIDVKQLTLENIVIGIDGERWISTHRQKTDSPSNIPLLPMAEKIITKYKDNPQCLNKGLLLPILSNQRMNSYLKEIGDVCGINKELTFHIARHTFATTVTLTNGVPIESVSKMLGHKNLKTTQHYAKIVDKKVGLDMSALKLKLENKVIAENQKAILVAI